MWASTSTTRALLRLRLQGGRPWSAAVPAGGLRRWASSSSAPPSASSTGPELVYTAPMARAVRLMKGVSLTSCILTSAGMPTLTYLSAQSASVIAKWAMCGTIMIFGLGTTSLFHVLFKPYVLRMWVEPPSVDLADPQARVTVETLTLAATRTTHQFRLADVGRPLPSMHPMISFRAGDKNFFIHPECIADERLVKRLMGDDFKIVPPPPKDDASREW